MPDIRHLAVVTTLGSRDAAHSLAQRLVEQNLAACAQITEIESIYRWEGAVQSEAEFRLLLKTRAERYDEIESAIRERHDYELPAIHAYPLVETYAPYADWIDAQTGV